MTYHHPWVVNWNEEFEQHQDEIEKEAKRTLTVLSVIETFVYNNNKLTDKRLFSASWDEERKIRKMREIKLIPVGAWMGPREIVQSNGMAV